MKVSQGEWGRVAHSRVSTNENFRGTKLFVCHQFLNVVVIRLNFVCSMAKTFLSRGPRLKSLELNAKELSYANCSRSMSTIELCVFVCREHLWGWWQIESHDYHQEATETSFEATIMQFEGGKRFATTIEWLKRYQAGDEALWACRW
jgi:hypothetical protein